MNEKPKSLGNSIIETLLSDSARTLISEYAEISIDAVLPEGILKEIPCVSSIVSIAKIGISISDRILVNKLFRFLTELQTIPTEKRQEMVTRLESDPVFGRKVGEHILEILIRIDGREKPKTLARAFAAYAKEKIDCRTLLRLNHAIEYIPNSELSNIRPFYNRTIETPFEIDVYTAQIFVNVGLAMIETGLGGVSYAKTDLCKIFLELNLDV